ncbi:hypothetical protein LEMLEM_LOCUS21124 [Lemmus lemmus]
MMAPSFTGPSGTLCDEGADCALLFQVESPTGASLSKMSSAPTSPTRAVGCSAWPTRGPTPTSLSCESRSSCCCWAAVSGSSAHRVVHRQMGHRPPGRAKSAGRTALLSGCNRQNRGAWVPGAMQGHWSSALGGGILRTSGQGEVLRTRPTVWVMVAGKALGCLVSCFGIGVYCILAFFFFFFF